MNLSFENQVALVTGAGSGIGLATAKAFAEAGASVVLADVHEDAARSAAEELVAADHKAIAVPCNVADEAEVATMVECTVSTFGRLDAAYNDGRHERHFERPANWATGVAGGDRRCRACRGGERLPDSTEDPQ